VIKGEIIKPNVPEWVHKALFYEVYPQTFFDTNGDGIGDIPGIIQKLDYIKSTGANAIWMNPAFVSPFRDGGYDISDYYNIAPRYGTNEDAKKLFNEVHKRGMHIIIDCVFGHTSIDHPWFKESCKVDSNKYTNRYIWTKSTWQNFDMCGSRDGTVINGYCSRDGNFLSNFFWAQPALNFGYDNPDPSKPWELPTNHPSVMELREEMKNFLRFWLNMGVDGFHMDMAYSLVKRDKSNKVGEIWKDVRKMLDKDYPEAFIIPEWCLPANSIPSGFHSDFLHWKPEYWTLWQAEPWRCLNGFYKGFSYFDQEGKGNIVPFMNLYWEQFSKTRDKGYISLIVSNLNLARTNINRSQKDLEIIFTFALTMPGVPFIWYGEEIGMRQLYNIPAVEGAYTPRSGSRNPMQWDGSRNHGFSTAPAGSLYLPTDTAFDAPNVASQDADPHSLLNFFRKINKLRETEKSLLNYADLNILYAEPNAYPLIYARSYENEVILVILNPSKYEQTAVFPSNLNLKKKLLLAGDKQTIIQSKDNILTVKTLPTSYSVYKLSKK
jgi:maltose alpha-D-glucosyltransferase/alpha-amylase